MFQVNETRTIFFKNYIILLRSNERDYHKPFYYSSGAFTKKLLKVAQLSECYGKTIQVV